MCVQEPQLCVEIKNSFIHVSDQFEKDAEAALYRSRAVSDYTGMCRAKEQQKDRTSVITASTAEDEQDWCTSTASSARTSRNSEIKHAELEQACATINGTSKQIEETRTTIMIRDIPNSYSTESLLELFNAAGFYGTYDFVYLPIDFRTSMSLGYAFVNFVSSWAAQNFMMYFDGFSSWHFASTKVCKLFWSDPNQGLEEHLERYRNSPVMHENVPDNFKPRLYQGGVRVPFPGPTKRIKLPRVRPPKHGFR